PVNRHTPLGPSLHTVVVHVSASSKLSKKLSANLGQHSTGIGYLRKRLRMSFKDYRRNQLRERIEHTPHRGGTVGNWLFPSELKIGKESAANRAQFPC